MAFVPVIAFSAESQPQTQGSWLSILPPLIAVGLAFLTKRIFFSLGLAIFAGAWLTNVASSGKWLDFGAFSRFFAIFFENLLDPWNLKVIAFVLCILAMISLMVVSRGLTAMVNKLANWVNSRRKSQLFTYLAGLAVFIDDYANTMIIGASMRPMTDQYRISREKLAFIIDATAAPVAGLAVISTWIGYEVGLFSDGAQSLNLDKDGYTIFLDAIAFRFYCILMLAMVLLTIWRGRELGKMHDAEMRALNTGRLIADDARIASGKTHTMLNADNQSHPQLGSALLPMIVLFAVLFVGLWIDGNGMQQLKESWFNLVNPMAWYEVIQATQNSSTVLLLSAVCGLLTAIFSARLYAKTPKKTLNRALLASLKSSLTPIGILLMAWSLKTITNDLHTGDYLVATLSPYLDPLLLPAIIFVIAAITAFGTGTSWGTMAILIPIAFPLGYALDGNSYGLITIVCLAAVLDGAIFGDHCSPISDTTIMSSIASHCDHMHHVRTQLPYSIVVGLTAIIVGYLPAAAGLPAWLSYLFGIIALLGLLAAFGRPVTAKA